MRDELDPTTWHVAHEARERHERRRERVEELLAEVGRDIENLASQGRLIRSRVLAKLRDIGRAMESEA